MMTDPIADLLTRIRNASDARKKTVSVPWSKMKERVADVLRREGYLGPTSVEEAGPRRNLVIELRYDDESRPVITGIERRSRPSLRLYVKSAEIPKVRAGMGVNILSTPNGILPDREARSQNVGGELICSIW